MAETASGGMSMMPAKELIAEVRVLAMGMDLSTRFLVLDMCDRLARQIRDNELLAQRVVELKRRNEYG